MTSEWGAQYGRGVAGERQWQKTHPLYSVGVGERDRKTETAKERETNWSRGFIIKQAWIDCKVRWDFHANVYGKVEQLKLFLSPWETSGCLWDVSGTPQELILEVNMFTVPEVTSLWPWSYNIEMSVSYWASCLQGDTLRRGEGKTKMQNRLRRKVLVRRRAPAESSMLSSLCLCWGEAKWNGHWCWWGLDWGN